MLSWSERKGERTVVLFRFAFTMSPVTFLPFNDVRHCPFGYSLRLSLRSAFLIVPIHADSAAAINFLSSRFFELVREIGHVVCVFGASGAWTAPYARPTFPICSSSHPK
jgi:hypothetical protein